MDTPTTIGGSILSGEKYTSYLCSVCEDKPNEQEEPRKRIWAEKINKSLSPPGTVSMFKMLPQKDNQWSKVDVIQGNGFGVKSVISMWTIIMIKTSPFAARGSTRRIEGTRKLLQTRSPFLIWRIGKSQVISFFL